MKLGLPLGSHRTQHASYVIREERLGNIFREARVIIIPHHHTEVIKYMYSRRHKKVSVQFAFRFR